MFQKLAWMDIMVTKQKHFLDSLRQMVSKTPEDICSNCQKVHEGELCLESDSSIGDDNQGIAQITELAYLVDLVSNHKIKIPAPVCKVGRDESNDIVVSGDQSISRHHLQIVYEGNQYYLDDNKSRHGTFLNGTPVKERQPINDGDVIKIGVSLFWFVVEADGAGEGSDLGSDTAGAYTGVSGEPAHLTVKSDQAHPSDPSSSTMNEIPVMSNEQTLLEHLRLKTHSFDQAGLFNAAQSQAATIAPQPGAKSGKSVDDTQSAIPAMPSLDPLLSPSNQGLTESFTKSQEPSPSASTSQPEKPRTPKPESATPESVKPKPIDKSNELNMAPTELISGSTIYDRLMTRDLTELVNKHNQLGGQIEKAQKERQEIADQLNTIRALGTGLIGGSNEELIDACSKVLHTLGWQINTNPADAQELQLNLSGKLAIARIIWTTDEPERTHLGQLSIAQTRLWCDQGQEPKGILIVSRLPNDNNEIPTLTKADYEGELANYAAKKNVCMMTSMQALAIYRDLLLKHIDANTIREKVIISSGWLEGFTLS
jgi:pSer/pThr/pTyr-binding forkhead associated (FHA) protein